jgi:RNA polymerase sigma-70 factor (ECF subfamily)
MSSQRPDDDTSLTLLLRLRANPADPAAWDQFVRHYQPMIRAWCLKWGSQSSDADDVAQDVLVKLLAAMRKAQYDPARSFRPWLKAVTHNAWNDFVASRRLKLAGSPDFLDSVADSSDALADLEERMEDAYDRELLELAMRRVEKRVKPTTWQAFRLTAVENRPGAEVARELGMAIALVFVARHRVQRMLEEEIRLLRGEPT